MDNTKYIDVKDFSEFCDEKSVAESHNILDKKFCLKHDWINASLRWEKNGYSVDIESLKDWSGKKWGTGYGAIRFCRKCKKIDCIHYWDIEKTYRIWINSKDYDICVIKHCKRCRRNIAVGGGRVINSYAIDSETGQKVPL